LDQLERLEFLNISDTDINSGVEYLPESLSGVDKKGNKKISYSTNQRPNSKVKKIKAQLDIFASEN
jgi:hypothetical protein